MKAAAAINLIVHGEGALPSGKWFGFYAARRVKALTNEGAV